MKRKKTDELHEKLKAIQEKITTICLNEQHIHSPSELNLTLSQPKFVRDVR